MTNWKWYQLFMPMSRFKDERGKVYTNVERNFPHVRLTFKTCKGIRVFYKWYLPVFFWRKLV